MKKIILLSAVTASMLFATNGDLMIADGAKATGMGGVGIAVSHGSESAYANPAMIKDVKGSEFSGYVTMFQPDVQFASDAANDTGGGVQPPSATPVPPYVKSDADQSFIPGFAYVHRNNENIVWGIALAGTAGMGTDYKNTSPMSGAFGMQTELQIAKLSVPVAYTNDNLTVAVAPVLQYSTLELNYQTPQGASNNEVDSSVGLGMSAGLAYDMGDVTLGAVYKSKIEANYKNNIGTAMAAFGVSTVTSGDQLDQPEEMGIGLAYEMGNNTFGVDLRRVNWGDVTGYKDFNWENQNIVAVGYRYQAPTWAIRAGYNHGKSPIQELNAAPQADGSTYGNAAVNYFNLAGFPAVVEEHFTLGGDYSVSDNLTLSLAAVYTPEVTNSFDTTAMSAGMAFNGALQAGQNMAAAQGAAQASSTGSTANVKHSQQAVTLGATYQF
jgi:long-chain fatty acid transport protein